MILPEGKKKDDWGKQRDFEGVILKLCLHRRNHDKTMGKLWAGTETRPYRTKFVGAALRGCPMY